MCSEGHGAFLCTAAHPCLSIGLPRQSGPTCAGQRPLCKNLSHKERRQHASLKQIFYTRLTIMSILNGAARPLFSAHAMKESSPFMALALPLGPSLGGAVAQTEMSSSRSLSRFLPTHLDEAEEQRCQLFKPEGRVLTSPGASLRCVKNRLRTRGEDIWATAPRAQSRE